LFLVGSVSGSVLGQTQVRNTEHGTGLLSLFEQKNEEANKTG